ncbi:hypothetical protein COR50_18145 [Chitinophaga caeni]|uniref:3-isopropylmalate dehydratase n=1 Tax=Chitinophaga caeni TaxID=2029983 RepID=A0A291QYI7_9BACT|nr:hypothetical protein [Chitinophaga caeni]ATL48933.1 hypothetical protein COR50_18145 [Chitinophaga caeni]
MHITDLNGCRIEVTHLKEALAMAKRYKEYRHEDSSFSEFDKRQKAYWTDMYEKLVTLKSQKSKNEQSIG